MDQFITAFCSKIVLSVVTNQATYVPGQTTTVPSNGVAVMAASIVRYGLLASHTTAVASLPQAFT
jgi:hypothetical protein